MLFVGIMRFIRILPYGNDPAVPPEKLLGDIPIRAFPFCEPFLAANRVGWLLFPPLSFELVWTGRDFLAHFDSIEEWIKVDRLLLPDFADVWDSIAPPAARDMPPPFLESFPERGVLQVWSGFFVETTTDLSTWIRGPINRNHPNAFCVIEGIIETEWWIGPLFTNFQFLKTDEPVRFEKDRPWLQIFEFPKVFHSRRHADKLELISPANIDEQLWTKYIQNSNRRNSELQGSYRRYSRRSSTKMI